MMFTQKWNEKTEEDIESGKTTRAPKKANHTRTEARNQKMRRLKGTRDCEPFLAKHGRTEEKWCAPPGVVPVGEIALFRAMTDARPPARMVWYSRALSQRITRIRSHHEGA